MGFKIVDDKILDLDADTAGAAQLDGRSIYNGVVYVKWSGLTGAGTARLEGSANGADWVTLESIDVTGTTGQGHETLFDNPWSFLRINYDPGTASAGKVEAWFNSKGQ